MGYNFFFILRFQNKNNTKISALGLKNNSSQVQMLSQVGISKRDKKKKKGLRQHLYGGKKEKQSSMYSVRSGDRNIENPIGTEALNNL